MVVGSGLAPILLGGAVIGGAAIGGAALIIGPRDDDFVSQ